MSLLALDLGTSCGWALERDCAPIQSGTVEFAKRAKDHDGDRLLRFSQWLGGMRTDLESLHERVDLVIYERALGKYPGRQPQRVFDHFEAVLLLWCARNAIPIKGVSQAELKRDAAGNGGADKSLIGAAVRRLGHKPGSTDEADALALLLTHTGALKAAPWKKKRDTKTRELAAPVDPNAPPF